MFQLSFNKLFYSICFCLVLLIGAQPLKAEEPDYIPGKIVFKMEPAEKMQLSAQMQINDNIRMLAQPFGLVEKQSVIASTARFGVERRIQEHQETKSADLILDDLSRTFTIKISETDRTLELVRRLNALPGIVYAEPFYNYELTDFPNDPNIGEGGHDYFEYHGFFDAWNISQSSEEIVIAIVDSGVLYTHEDLRNGLWRNPDPGRASYVFNQVENDTIGWNFWQSGNVFIGEEPVQNNNPIGDFSDHGTFVAGLAAADTDNGIGIAGAGFNASYMAVKVGGTREFPRNVPFGPYGVLYAAINGADIINCSFGSTNFSFFFEDIINAATEMGSLIIAAAGNNNNDVPFFPASYDNVLSVGAEFGDLSSRKATFSSYGYFVDVFAVGQSILSTTFTFNENTGNYTEFYRRSSGTSFAAPIVSGLAALIRHKYPDWSPGRVAAQIRATAKSIENQNLPYRTKMGNGSIQAYEALTNPQPGIVMREFEIVNQFGRKATVGEQANVRITLKNVGESTPEIRLELSGLEGQVRLNQALKSVGRLENGDTEVVEFPIEFLEQTDPELAPVLRLGMEDSDNYRDFAILPFFDFDYDVVESNDFLLSIGSDGTIAYRATQEAFGGEGMLDLFLRSLIFEASFMVGVQPENFMYVMDNTRSITERNSDFEPKRWFRYAPEAGKGFTQFESINEEKYPGLVVRKEIFDGNTVGVPNTLFFRYLIINDGDQDIRALYPGMFINWQIPPFSENKVKYIPSDSLQIVHSSQEGSPFVTLAHMGNIASALAIDNSSSQTLASASSREDSLRFGIYYDNSGMGFDGFTDAEKRLALRAGLEKPDQDTSDVSTLSSSGPYQLRVGEQIVVGFILSYAQQEQALINQIRNARAADLFEVSPPGESVHTKEPVDIPNEIALFPPYPNPFNPLTQINYYLDGVYDVRISVYDILGRQVKTLMQNRQTEGFYTIPFDASNLASGQYIILLEAGNKRLARQVTLIK